MTLDELCEENKRLKGQVIEQAGEIARLKRELADERIASEHAANQSGEFRIKVQAELNKRATQIKTLIAALKRHHGCARWNADDAALTEEAQ